MSAAGGMGVAVLFTYYISAASGNQIVLNKMPYTFLQISITTIGATVEGHLVIRIRTIMRLTGSAMFQLVGHIQLMHDLL